MTTGDSPTRNSQTIKALSLWQPWATLVAIGAKTIETRHWATSYRGPLAIHAAKRKPERWLRLGAAQVLDDGFGHPTICLSDRSPHLHENLPLGAVVATARLVDCLPIVGWKDGRPDNHSVLWWPTRVVSICGDDPTDVDEDGNPFARVWTYSDIPQASGPLGCWSSGLGESPAYGDFTPGRYGWVLEDIVALSEPVEVNGHQGLWNWEPPCSAAPQSAAPDEAPTSRVGPEPGG